MHSHVSHAAFSRSRYSNFVSRTASKCLHLLSCNTLRISFGFVIIYYFKYWRPECKENPLLNGLFWIYSSRMGSAGWLACPAAAHHTCTNSHYPSSSHCPVLQTCGCGFAIPGVLHRCQSSLVSQEEELTGLQAGNKSSLVAGKSTGDMELTSVLRTPESCVLVGKMTATGWIAVLKPKKI